MSSSKTRLERENKAIRTMIKIYCKKFHAPKVELCPDCAEIFKYAEGRLNYCRFGEDKPTCEKCPIHCYNPEMRASIVS